MSSPAILVVLLALVLSAIVLGVRRRLGTHRQSATQGIDTGLIVGTRDARAPSLRACPACGGFGFTTRMQPVTETKTAMQTELYTDYSGRTATRMVARPKTTTVMRTTRVPCGFCGGSGRSRS